MDGSPRCGAAQCVAMARPEERVRRSREATTIPNLPGSCSTSIGAGGRGYPASGFAGAVKICSNTENLLAVAHCAAHGGALGFVSAHIAPFRHAPEWTRTITG